MEFGIYLKISSLFLAVILFFDSFLAKLVANTLGPDNFYHINTISEGNFPNCIKTLHLKSLPFS